MPTQTVANDVRFYYTDSGVPAKCDYATLFIIHGHTFHSGIFNRMSSAAPSQSLRVICVNRREYPGSSSYSQEELKVVNDGTSPERAKFLNEQGVHLCLLVDDLIDALALPQEAGIAIAGWSLGSAFAIAMMTAIENVPDKVQHRLRAYVRRVILWDPPAVCLGSNGPPGSYVPLFDKALPQEARLPAFGVWVSSYYKHGDLSSGDFAQLNQRDPDASRPSTLLKMTQEEICEVTDFGPSAKYETTLLSPGFASVHWEMTNRAIFDPGYRELWSDLDVWHVYGDANCWPMLYAVWCLKKMMKGKEIRFRPIEDAPHVYMWEQPDITLRVLKDIISSGNNRTD